MTITMGYSTVADSISGLSIAGITVKDISAIPEAVQRLTPILFPQPTDFITGMEIKRQSYGGAGTPAMDMTYTLNYVFLQSEVGSGRGLFSVYPALISNIAKIVKAILENDNITGAVDMEMPSVTTIGSITDPAGNEYWGALFALKITEQIQ
jgi:hypothetical protein